MKILLDECVTKHLKPYLSDFEVMKVREMQWSGIKNGKLMALCVENGFDVLLTIDKNLRYQQNLDRYLVHRSLPRKLCGVCKTAYLR